MIRPLLDVARAELREYLAARGQAFREDATNADVDDPAEPGPARADSVSRITIFAGHHAMCSRARRPSRGRTKNFFTREAIELAARIVLTDVDAVEDRRRPALSGAPRALARAWRSRRCSGCAGSKSIGFDHVERLLALARRGDAGA